MRRHGLLLAALTLALGGASCTDDGTPINRDGKVKYDRGPRDRGPDDSPQPDLASLDQQVVDLSKALDKKPSADKKLDGAPKGDLSKLDGLLKGDTKVADLSKVDLGPLVGKLVINEVDYSQPGADTKEFIEIYNGTSAAVNLGSLAVVLVNGSNNQEYARVQLGAGTLAAGGYLVIGPAAVTVDPGVTKVSFTGSIQDGDPDGVALINTTSNTLVDALCYGGAMTSVTITGFAAPVSLVEGTVLAPTVVDGNADGSLSRLPNGQDTNNANADWKFTATSTPGKANQ